MKNTILQSAFEEISQDTKLIRLATITTFVHSVIFLLYIGYWASTVLAKVQGGDNDIAHGVFEMLVGISSISIRAIILICIPLLIGYSILPPIGEGAMIYYLNNPRKQGTASFGKGLTKFLQMFEFDAAISFFNIIIFLVAISRVYVMDIGGNILIILAMSMWFIIILLASFLLPYTRFFIVLEHMKFFDAMKASMETAVQHFNITFRYILVDVVLHLRFIINIIIVFGIPLGLIYLGSWLSITQNGFIQTIIVLLIIILFLITAYINGIIEAFFVTYWYKVFKHIKEEQAQDEAAIEQGEVGDPGTQLATKKEETQQQVPQQIIINQYIVQPGATPPHPTQPQAHEQIIEATSEYTIPQDTSSYQNIPLPPEAEKYIQKQATEGEKYANEDEDKLE